MTDELAPPPIASAGDKAIGAALAVLGEFPVGSTDVADVVADICSRGQLVGADQFHPPGAGLEQPACP